MRCISPLSLRQNGSINVVPCGKCNFCLSSKRDDWSFRLRQELKVSTSASFITLTYATEKMPVNSSGLLELRKSDCQAFMKRLRKVNCGTSFFSPRRSGLALWPEQSVDLDHQATVGKLGEAVEHIHVAVIGEHHEELAARRILPPEAHVARQTVRKRVVLEQAAEEHPRREAIIQPRSNEVLVEAPLRQVHPVERDARLE